jgi:environmental stress-induced protein Ves
MAVIRQGELAVTAWKNGRGRKADIASGDGWFVGLAWLDEDAPFSDFTGFDRTCLLLDGHGFTLSFDGQPDLGFTAPGAVHSFAGESPTTAHLLDGPCLVMNVMSRRGHWSHRLDIGAIMAPHGYAVVLRGSVAGGATQPGAHHAGPGDVLVLPHDGAASDDLLLATATLLPPDDRPAVRG